MAKLVEYTFSERDERMDALKDHDFDGYFSMLEREVRERRTFAACLMRLANEHGCVKIEKDDKSRWYYLHRSWKYHNDLQLTAWDDDGPVWDNRIRKPDDFSYLMNGTVKAYAGD